MHIVCIFENLRLIFFSRSSESLNNEWSQYETVTVDLLVGFLSRNESTLFQLVKVCY